MLATLMIAVAGCGGSGTTADPDSSSTPTHQEVKQTPPPKPKPAFKPKVRIETRSEQEDGSSARQKLGLGKITAVSDLEDPGDFAGLVGICAVDEQRDAVIPGRLTIENTTGGFPIEIDSGPIVGLLSPGDYPGVEPYENVPITEVAQEFSDGPSCLETTGTGTTPGDAEFNLSEGETLRHNFLVVIHGYYSPAHPEGDEEGVADLRARIYSPPPIAGDWEEVCVSASAPLDGDAVRLDGKPINNYHVYDPELPSC